MSSSATAVDPRSQPARSQLFWGIFGALALAQLFAFWLVCTHQVRRAEARHNEVLVQQMALSDCLQYVPGSTIASCQGGKPARGAAATVPGAVPVGFYR